MLVPGQTRKPPPTHQLAQSGSVVVLQPPRQGVPREEYEELLALVAFKDPSTDSFGVPYFLVWEACSIAANNRSGVLHELKTDAPIPTPASNTFLLPPGHYTFVLEGNIRHFQICPNFDWWRPPVEVPSWWDGVLEKATELRPPAVSDLSSTIRAMGPCIMTGALMSRTDAAHLVPVTAKDWWERSGHGTKVLSKNNINNAANVVPLRADLSGRGLDAGHFMIFPFHSKPVAVFVTRDCADLAHDYHLAELKLPSVLNLRNLHARFAWNVFKLLESTWTNFDVIPLPAGAPALKRPRPESSQSQSSARERRMLPPSLANAPLASSSQAQHTDRAAQQQQDADNVAVTEEGDYLDIGVWNQRVCAAMLVDAEEETDGDADEAGMGGD